MPVERNRNISKRKQTYTRNSSFSQDLYIFPIFLFIANLLLAYLYDRIVPSKSILCEV